MSLNTPNGNVELLIWCNPAASGAYWLANDAAVTAGSVLIINETIRDRADGQDLDFYNDLVNGGGAQDSYLPTGGASNAERMLWHSIFTANQGGTLSKWDVYLTNFEVGNADCTATVYGNNAGTQQVVTVP